jgi:hypothetical protein
LFQKRNNTARNAGAVFAEVKPNCLKKETTPQKI